MVIAVPNQAPVLLVGHRFTIDAAALFEPIEFDPGYLAMLAGDFHRRAGRCLVVATG